MNARFRILWRWLGLGMLLAPPALAAGMVVEGSATVVDGDLAAAREQATRRALAKAVEFKSATVNASSLLWPDALFETVQVRSTACTEAAEQISERRLGNELTVVLQVSVREGGDCRPLCRGVYINRVLVTGFAMEYPQQKLPEEKTILSQATALELARKIVQGRRLLADFSASTFPYASPARAPELYQERNGVDSVITLQARNFRTQYVLSGIYRDFGLEGGSRQRRIEIEAFLHDGVDGALLARKSFVGRASGAVLLTSDLPVGTHGFYQGDLGRAWGGILQEIADWTGEQAACLPFSARILKTDGRRLHIDAGAEAGLSVGDTLNIHTWKQPPITGLNGLSLGMEKRIQTGAVIRAVYPKFSVIEVEAMPKGAAIKEGDVVYAM